MRKKPNKLISLQNLWLILIVIIFIGLRLYFIKNNLIFDWDQEQFSNQIWDIVKEHKLTLLGPRVTNVRGFFLAPYFTYILIPFYLITNLHPSAMLIFLAILNIMFILVSYFGIKKIFGKISALIFLTLWAFTRYHVEQDIITWWPVTLPLGVVLVWFLLYNIYKKNKLCDWLLIGLTLGLFINMHFTFILIIFFVVVFWLYQFWQTRRIPWFKVFVSVFSGVVMFWPLLLFDIRHNFLNTKLFLGYFLNPEKTVDLPFIKTWPEVFTNFVQSYTILKSVPLAFIFYLIIMISLIYLFIKNREFIKNFFFASLILWIALPFIFIKYHARPSEYYFLVYYPFIHLTIASILITLKKPILSFLIIGLFIITNLWSIIKIPPNNNYNLFQKEKVVLILKSYVKENYFNVSFDGPPNHDTGFRYLIRYYNLKATDKNAPLYSINAPPKKDDLIIGPYGLMIPKKNE